jgi:glycine dehydrogenase subunit 1
MPYVSLTDADKRKMLADMGMHSVEELYAPIPENIRLKKPLDVPPALSEMELVAELERLAAANTHAGQAPCFLGAGAYDHFIPSVVDALAGRGEFVTAYTPYQAEASQGSLQVFYEFQTMVCQLTGMEVANASLYEAATGLVEGCYMARSAGGRGKVLISAGVNPDYRQVLETYFKFSEVEYALIPLGPDGRTDAAALTKHLDDKTAAVVMQTPNFLGCVEEAQKVSDLTHRAGALLVAAFDPISLGVMKRPGQYGADVAIGEGQPLGIPLQFGAPYLGLFTCKADLVRKSPGRLVGRTVDKGGRTGFCLTLTAREQHIKRERASSNICTNQGLMAVRGAIYMAAMGPQGLRQAANLCLQKAHYAAKKVAEVPGLSLAFPSTPFFKEFAVRVKSGDAAKVLDRARDKGVLAGVPVAKLDPKHPDLFLVAVTEKRTKAEIDKLAEALRASV